MKKLLCAVMVALMFTAFCACEADTIIGNSTGKSTSESTSITSYRLTDEEIIANRQLKLLKTNLNEVLSDDDYEVKANLKTKIEKSIEDLEYAFGQERAIESKYQALLDFKSEMNNLLGKSTSTQKVEKLIAELNKVVTDSELPQNKYYVITSEISEFEHSLSSLQSEIYDEEILINYYEYFLDEFKFDLNNELENNETLTNNVTKKIIEEINKLQDNELKDQLYAVADSISKLDVDKIKENFETIKTEFDKISSKETLVSKLENIILILESVSTVDSEYELSITTSLKMLTKSLKDVKGISSLSQMKLKVKNAFEFNQEIIKTALLIMKEKDNILKAEIAKITEVINMLTEDYCAGEFINNINEVVEVAIERFNSEFKIDSTTYGGQGSSSAYTSYNSGSNFGSGYGSGLFTRSSSNFGSVSYSRSSSYSGWISISGTYIGSGFGSGSFFISRSGSNFGSVFSNYSLSRNSSIGYSAETSNSSYYLDLDNKTTVQEEIDKVIAEYNQMKQSGNCTEAELQEKEAYILYLYEWLN